MLIWVTQNNKINRSKFLDRITYQKVGNMIAKIEFDMQDDEDRHKYAQFLGMERNDRFWHGLYDEVFRKHIRYGNSDEVIDTYQKIWDEIAEYRDKLEFE